MNHEPNGTEARHKYRQLCATETTIPIFSQFWWLDAVCGPDRWDVCLAERNGHVIGSLPYYFTRRYLFRLIRMPPFTQSFRLWIQSSNSSKPDKRASHEKAVLTELIRKLPPFDSFQLRFYHSLTNWLPFYWQGFRQTTCYTYVIEDLSDLDAVFQAFSHAKRKNLKRAAATVTLGPELSAREFHEHHTRTLGKQGDRTRYSRRLLERIHEAVYARECGKIFTAVDREGEIHAAIFVVWDRLQAYYLISSIDPDYRASGAATYLLQKAMEHLSTRTGRFDFEGSMIEGVENSFRQFGARQTSYFLIQKMPSKLLLFRQFLQDCRR
jgi:hypothetical protein